MTLNIQTFDIYIGATVTIFTDVGVQFGLVRLIG